MPAARAGRSRTWLCASGAGSPNAGASSSAAGLDGVMAGACRGAKEAGGTTIGILPGQDRGDANAWVDVAVPTGLGQVRNVLVVRASDAVVAVGGSHGTLAEMAFALEAGRPLVTLRSWTVTAGGTDSPDPAVEVTSSPEEAVEAAFRATGRGGPQRPSPA